MSLDSSTEFDILLVGGGIMSATLGTFLHLLEPSWKIAVLERMPTVAQESSNAWNNAGTGHSGLCELNFTPESQNGDIEVARANRIAELFQISKQFYSYLVENEIIDKARLFITSVPHISFVKGDDNVNFLQKRFEALRSNPLFSYMNYTEDQKRMSEWMPLIMEDRDHSEIVAATRDATGTNLNFGALTRLLFAYLGAKAPCMIETLHEATDLSRTSSGKWCATFVDRRTGQEKKINANFVFIGGGGGALPLLQKSGIPEASGIAGFPVSGKFLRCRNKEIVERHKAKVYGKAAIGAPPMSVPHLDTRIIDGERHLLFGPYAGFSTRFLKNGSLMDFFRSIRSDNIEPMLAVADSNWPLVKYLINQILQTHSARVKTLQQFIPTAREKDWSLITAGQRVQIIKKNPDKGGELRFGTEIISNSDGTLSALLGASPGASVAPSIMLDLLKKCFPDKIYHWKEKLLKIIPSYGQSLARNPTLNTKLQDKMSQILKIKTRE